MTGRTVALIVAAGQGSRMGGPPKQFLPLGGKPVIAHCHAALANHPAIDAVLVVIGAGQEAELEAALGPVPTITGGSTRRESVLSGLETLADDPPARVLIHDAARPFVPARVIDALLAALDSQDGAVPALAVADTLARSDNGLGDVVPRERLVRVQTPQAFRFDAVFAAHRAWPADEEATDDAQMVRRLGGSVLLVEGDPMLDKLTYPVDLAAAESRLAMLMEVRSATGFDVHRLIPGDHVRLGGIAIGHDKALSGHSDADVALHAITDALLGTVAAGDIGMHFPPGDSRWRGADSAQFLQHAAGMIVDRGGTIDFVDVTLICEAPKIGPHRTAIQASIAALLRLDPARVSVKATTTERLGFTGREEGIAAQAIATIRLPRGK